MAKRVCGDVTIELYWTTPCPERPAGAYRAVVRCYGTSYVVFLHGNDPKFLAIVPRDMPMSEGYDRAAGVALMVAMEQPTEKGQYIADAAASGIREGDYMVFRSRKAQRGTGLGVAAQRLAS